MLKNKILIPIVLIFLALIIISSSLFVVDQREQALVFQFGQPKRLITNAGLNAKLPFIQNTLFFEKRILDLDPPVEQILLGDKKRINVNSYARYKIVKPLTFFTRVGNIASFNSRFGSILNSTVRQVMGRYSLKEVLNEKRDDIMNQITKATELSGHSFGVEVIDVRLGRTDLPVDISKAVYLSMQSERIQEANLLRAEGDQAKQEIIAQTNKDKVIILAEAEKQSAILMGEGVAKRNEILAKAYQKDPQFFEFYKSLEAYKETFSKTNNQLLLNQNMDFLKYMFKKQ